MDISFDECGKMIHQITLRDVLDFCLICVTKSKMDITCNIIIGLAVCGNEIRS